MLHTRGGQLFQRVLPTVSRLVRQTCNEIDVDVLNSELAQTFNVRRRCCRCVQTTYGANLLIDERLQAEAHAIDARFNEGLQSLRSQCAGGRLNRNLSVPADLELTTNQRKNFFELLGRERSGRATTKINRIHSSIEISIEPVRQGLCPDDLFPQATNVLPHQLPRKHARREIAEAALGAAKRDGNVDPQWHVGK